MLVSSECVYQMKEREVAKIRRLETMHELVLHTEMVCLIIKTKNRSGRRDKTIRNVC